MNPTNTHGICLDADSLREEIHDVLHNGVEAHDLDEDTARAILALSDEEINAVIVNSVDDDFWQAYDSARGEAISRLAHAVREQKAGIEAIRTLDDDQRDALDELVHDVASRAASDAINAGDQMEYLLSNGFSIEEVMQRIGGPSGA